MNGRILLFGRDPGGAQAVAAMVGALRAANYDVVASGLERGLEILASQCGPLLSFPYEQKEEIRRFIQDCQPDLIITGTSGQGMSEKLLWRCAEELGVATLAILDSWVNYGIRFSSRDLSQLSTFRKQPDQDYLPTYIAVMDELARREAVADGLPSERILVTGQPHFDSLLKKKFPTTQKKKPRALLFVSEPLAQAYGSNSPIGYDEKTIFKEILKALTDFNQQQQQPIELFVQLHPRELPDSYADFESSPWVRCLTPAHPHDLLFDVQAVLGMSSNLLVEAAVMGVRVALVQIGLTGPNPSVLFRSGYCESWDTAEKLRSGLPELLFGSRDRGRAAKFAVEPAIPKLLRIISQLCQTKER